LQDLATAVERIPSIGEIFALGSGLVWAVAIILFRILGRKIHPLSLNLFKTVLAFVLILITVLVFGQPLFPDVPARDIVLLLISGVVGIAVSDTLFFQSLNRIGASPLAIVDCLYSPFVIGLSFLFLGERMTGWQLFGVVLIVSAILTVTRHKSEERVSRKDLVSGIAFGVLAVLFIAVSIVIIKPVLDSTPLVWSTTVRLFGGTAALALFVPFHPDRRRILAPLADLSNWRALLPASFFGSYVSLLLWLGGMKYARVSVAAALNQLNAIFIVVLAAIFLKERLTPWKIVAVALAFAGAYLASRPF
jgi:drug/metabolite transporter (DMT)-like permease